MSRHKWVCTLCNSGVMGPKAPRRDSVIRFCLKCSAKRGFLIGRVCPALERVRAEKDERRRDKEKKQRAAVRRRKDARVREGTRERAKRKAAREEVAGDLHAELRRLWPIARPLAGRELPEDPPALSLCNARSTGTSGRAWTHEYRIHLTVGLGDDAAGVIGTLAHEVAHFLPAATEAPHGPAFWRLLCDLIEVAYDAAVDRDAFSIETTAYARQSFLEAVIRSARGYE